MRESYLMTHQNVSFFIAIRDGGLNDSIGLCCVRRFELLEAKFERVFPQFAFFTLRDFVCEVKTLTNGIFSLSCQRIIFHFQFPFVFDFYGSLMCALLSSSRRKSFYREKRFDNSSRHFNSIKGKFCFVFTFKNFQFLGFPPNFFHSEKRKFRMFSTDDNCRGES